MLGLDVIGQQQNGAWNYFGSDGLGSARLTFDALGAINSGTSFSPYGVPFEQLGLSMTDVGFTGEQDMPGGLQYLRASCHR